jgi:hypothetical protein
MFEVDESWMESRRSCLKSQCTTSLVAAPLNPFVNLNVVDLPRSSDSVPRIFSLRCCLHRSAQASNSAARHNLTRSFHSGSTKT